jgi:hypothetical protein
MNSNEMLMFYVLTPLLVGTLSGFIIRRDFHFLKIIQTGAALAIIGKSMVQMKASQSISLIVVASGIFVLGVGISFAIKYAIYNKTNNDKSEPTLNDKNNQDFISEKSESSKNRHVSVLDRYK